jgi:hypothetical protein
VPEEDPIKCPKCGSTQITAGDKGFGLGRAAGCLLLLGPAGLLGGLLGSKRAMITCLKCGNKWEAGKAQPRKYDPHDIKNWQPGGERPK